MNALTERTLTAEKLIRNLLLKKHRAPWDVVVYSDLKAHAFCVVAQLEGVKDKLSRHAVPEELILDTEFHRILIQMILTDFGLSGDDIAMAGAPVAPPKRTRVVERPTVPVTVEEVPIEEDHSLDAPVEELETTPVTAATYPTPALSDDLEPATAAPAPVKARTAKPVAHTPASVVPPSTDISMEIDAAGMERDWRERMVFYGYNKCGKTKLLDDSSTLILNFEEGTTTIADKPVASRALQIRIRNRQKIEQVYWMLKAAKPGPDGKGLIIQTKLGERYIDTIAWDTVTKGLFWVLREALLGETKAEDLTAPMPGGKETYYKRYPVYDWMNNWLTLFRDFPLHTVYLCQQREPKAGEDVAATKGCPDVPDMIRELIQGDADVIGHLFIKFSDDPDVPPKFVIEFGPNPEYVTGDRTGTLPKVINHSTVRKLIGHIHKKLAERTGA